MLKFAKHLLLIVGAIVIVGAAILMLYEFRLSSDSLNAIVAMANQQKSNTDATSFNATQLGILWSTLACLVGGLVLGIGIGVPSATFKQRYEQRQAEAARQLAEAAAKDAPKPDVAAA